MCITDGKIVCVMNITGKGTKVITHLISDILQLGWSKDRTKELHIYNHLYDLLAQTACVDGPSRPTSFTQGSYNIKDGNYP